MLPLKKAVCLFMLYALLQKIILLGDAYLLQQLLGM